MENPESIRQIPLLLQGSKGALHARYYVPTGVSHPAGDLLFVPPFAEEMNRCRAMVALQARALAQVGVGSLVMDPWGTGDSSGDFVDATWEQWQDDLRSGLNWLRTYGQGCRSLWAIRLGAVMASQLAARDTGIRHLLFWQPVLDGKAHYTQFLRIRIAAEMNLPDRVTSTSELRRRTASGESIEVSGYRIGPTLAAQLDTATVERPGLTSTQISTDWIEVLPSPDAELSPAVAQNLARLRDDGADIRSSTVVGPAFWQVHEREVAPALIDATTACVAAWPGDPAPATCSRQASRLPAVDACADAAEQPVTFNCGADQLSGVLHRTPNPARQGVVIVVAGGPQYRAGAHRQFVSMARRLVEAGIPVLRFDLRGMGDSSGEHAGYRASEPDIRAAVDALKAWLPTLTDIVLLGECESASGILFYAWRDARIRRTVLINPWVRTDEGRAQVIVRHYYLDRLLSADFWKQVLTGRYRARESIASAFGVIRAYVKGRVDMARQSAKPELDDISELPLPVRTAEGLRRFTGRSLLLMSGFDLIAREFDEVTSASRAWDGLLESDKVDRFDIEGADHTFSREVWKKAAADRIADWLVDTRGA